RFTPGTSALNTYASLFSVTSKLGENVARSRAAKLENAGIISRNGSQRRSSRIVRKGSHSVIGPPFFFTISATVFPPWVGCRVRADSKLRAIALAVGARANRARDAF